MQPNWSPHGTRIAFWGLRAAGGQRDIFSVAADGSERDQPVHLVTDDVAVDWSPTWSADGASLYFSSRRGGPMNLWRVAIEEASGRPLGEPEPVTTPSNWSGYASFSRDGSRMAFASLNWRSTLQRVQFDPVREALVGSPTPMLRGTRSIRDHAVSPDGRVGGVHGVGRAGGPPRRARGWQRVPPPDRRRVPRSQSRVVARRTDARVLLGPDRQVRDLDDPSGRKRPAAADRQQGADELPDVFPQWQAAVDVDRVERLVADRRHLGGTDHAWWRELAADRCAHGVLADVVVA